MSRQRRHIAIAQPVRHAARIGLLLIGLCSGSALAADVEAVVAQSTPRFWTIDRWTDRIGPTGNTAGGMGDPCGLAVKALCQFYGIPFRRESIIAASPSPLAWPQVFASTRLNPRYVKLRFEQLARYNALATRGIVVLDTRDLTDSLLAEVSKDHPVILNHPSAPVLYGYDTREPDAWWLVYHSGQPEILFESERREEYMYWSDDPAANLAWAVTGRDTQATGVSAYTTMDESYQWLEIISRSVKGDHERGIVPYPLSLRTLRDSISSSAGGPVLQTPVDLSDPLGIRRARQAREFAISLLERMSMQVVDTMESRPLRLAMYFYHNSVGALNRLDSLLYDHPHRTLPPDRLEQNWMDLGRRSDAAATVTDILEWEKQAAEQIDTVLTRRTTSNASH